MPAWLRQMRVSLRQKVPPYLARHALSLPKVSGLGIVERVLQHPDNKEGSLKVVAEGCQYY